MFFSSKRVYFNALSLSSMISRILAMHSLVVKAE